MVIPKECMECDGEIECSRCTVPRQRELDKLGSMSMGITKANATKLKPCPFCGGEAELFALYWICCKKCHASTGVFGTENGAIKAWNRRANDATN